MKFGTDGVRGRVGVDFTVDDMRDLGLAIGRVLGGDPARSPRAAVIGGDTRESTPALQAAVSAGLAATGLEVNRIGIAPTPMIAYTAARLDAIGIAISASHNPYHDNGVKVFGPGGRKLSVADQAAIEQTWAAGDTEPETAAPIGDLAIAGQWYLQHVLGALGGRDLDGLDIVVDAANGAASAMAAEVFGRAGADVVVINDRPDGRNINVACGATEPSAVAGEVVARSASFGLALDGDADRLIAVDEFGAIVDGDAILAICAADMKARGLLRNSSVAVTVMTNLGFHHAMRDLDITVVETPVGDRFVLEALDAGELSLGGEQSGHIIFRDLATTGDGLLTGLILADICKRAGRPLSVIAAAAMRRLPQVLVNVALAQRITVLDPTLAARIAVAEAALEGRGRILVRPSGTEPLVRVMVEAPTEERAAAVAADIAEMLRRALASGAVE